MAPEKLDRAKITEELELLQLEETRERVHDIRTRREGHRRRVEGRNMDLIRARERQQAIEDNCWHKKGGKGVAMLSRGSDHHYAVVKHQLAHGPILIFCQRCGHVEEPPPVYLNRRNASQADKAEYKRLYDKYVWWLNLPTDNEMSGTQLFVISEGQEAA